MLINIPEEYKENERNGVCRICGKGIQKPFRLYCSMKCSIKYSKCFKSWMGVREEILKRDGHKCAICGKPGNEVDHIKAIVNGGAMWDYDNLRVLCHNCHCKKTGKDVYIKNRLKANQTTLS